MRLIVYISEYTGKASDVDRELTSIVKIAKANNARLEVTGVLFYQHGKFVQIIEGEDKPLSLLMKKIELDNRHKNISYLVDEVIDSHSLTFGHGLA